MTSTTGEWHWRSERAASGSGSRAGGAKPLGTEQFPSQGEAESWLGETYPDLVVGGVHAVSLYEGDRFVYGPMSLDAE